MISVVLRVIKKMKQMNQSHIKHLIEYSELVELMNSNDDLVILDASKIGEGHMSIKGARHFDIGGDFSDPESDLPNTFPTQERFEKMARSLGISNTDTIVVVDNKSIFFSPRVWFMFKVFGFENVLILNGSLAEWERKGGALFPLVPYSGKSGDFNANYNSEMIVTKSEIEQNNLAKSFCVLDARSNGRYTGEAPEPREGLESGHMPNSCSLPYADLLEDGRFKNQQELKKIFDALNLEDEDWVYSCGSGITACIIAFAAYISLGIEPKVYDGSWTEYAQSGMPIYKGN